MMGRAEMARQGHYEFQPLIVWAAPAREEEADYCATRAEVEARRAAEATHPAARDAHLEMAALYRKRALAARPIGNPAGRIRKSCLDA